jgi:streptogramin lyase
LLCLEPSFIKHKNTGLGAQMKKPIGLIASMLIGASSLLMPLMPAMADSAPVTEYPVPGGINTSALTTGSDGNLWVAGSGGINKMSTSGTVLSEYPVFGGATSIASGSDGNIWYTGFSGVDYSPGIGKMTTSGAVTTYPLPSGYSSPENIIAGPNGNLWFTATNSNTGGYVVGDITPSGSITTYPLPSNILIDPGNANEGAGNLTVGPDGNLWFAGYDDINANLIAGSITPAGSFTSYTIEPLSGSSMYGSITTGPDGNLWFANYLTNVNGSGNNGNLLGSITTSGSVKTYPLPSSSQPVAITTGSDGNLWLTDSGTTNQAGPSLDSVTSSGAVTTYPIPSGAEPTTLISGPNNNLWFADGTGKLGEMTPPVTTPPTITSATSASTGMNVPFDYTATTTGTPAPSITESGALPTGLTFTDNGDGTADLAGMAAAGTNKTYPIMITATNSAGSTSITLTLNVTTATAAPQVTSSNSETETFGVPFSSTVVASGYPIPAIKKSKSTSVDPVYLAPYNALPAGVTFKDNLNGTATISGTPDASAVGVYNINLTAKNSLGSAVQSFTLTITKAPVFKAIPTKDLTATVGTRYSVTSSVSAFVSASMSETGTLPNGLSFMDNGNNTATISGTPQVGSGGTYSITLNATNSNGAGSKTVTIKVDEAPAITSASSATATIGAAFSYQVSAYGFPTPKYSLTGTLPKGVHFSTSTGVFSGIPLIADHEGAYALTITATNSIGTTSQSFTLTLN